MFCPNCGNPNNDEARFCGKCGTPLMRPAAPPPPQKSAPPPAPPPPPQPQPQNPAFAAPPPPPPPPPPPLQTYAPPAYQTAPTAQPVPAAPSNPLRYKIFGDNLPAVSIRLDAGESIFTESGGMTWMDRGIVMETNMKGGLMKGLGRMISGESLFMATFTSQAADQEIVIASSFPGSICALDLKGSGIIVQKSGFLCAQPSVMLSAHVVRGLASGLFGGEGFILQRLTGFGTALIEIDGSLVERVLAPGESIRVDTGNVAAFEESVVYQVETVKGFKNILFGGEGLFITTLTGPGKVWLQTMTLPGFARQILPFLPKSGSN